MIAVLYPAAPQAIVTNNVDGLLTTILVVDDEAPIRSALRRFLRIKGHDVVEAKDGVEALKLLAVHRVDVAIVDLMMPRMNGVELIERMQSEFPKTRVVVISAYSEISGLSTDEPNVVTIIKKPFELRVLEQAVELALGKGQAARQG